MYLSIHDFRGGKLVHLPLPHLVFGGLRGFGPLSGCGLWEVSPLLLQEAFESHGGGPKLGSAACDHNFSLGVRSLAWGRRGCVAVAKRGRLHPLLSTGHFLTLRL